MAGEKRLSTWGSIWRETVLFRVLSISLYLLVIYKRLLKQIPPSCIRFVLERKVTRDAVGPVQRDSCNPMDDSTR